MRYLLLTALLLLLPTNGFSQDSVYKSVVRVYVHENSDCYIDSYGSGFLVSPTQVLTNHHVVSDRRRAKKGAKCAIQLRFYNGDRAYAVVISQNRPWDVALLEIKAVNFPVLQLGERPTEGQTAFVHGCGSDYEYRAAQGTVGATNISPPGLDITDLMTVEGTPSRFGDSGGPITDLRGLVIGILNTTDDSDTGGIMIDRVQKVFEGKLHVSEANEYILGDSK